MDFEVPVSNFNILVPTFFYAWFTSNKRTPLLRPQLLLPPKQNEFSSFLPHF